MKTENKKIAKKVGAALAMAIFLPSISMAQTEVSGMSDSTKLSLLVGMLIFQIILIFTINGIIKSLTGSKDLWSKFLKNKASKTGAASIALLLLSSPLLASTEAAPFVLDSGLENLLLAINAVLLVFIIILLGTLRTLIRVLTHADKTEAELAQEKTWVDSFMHSMTDAVPLEQEEDVLTDHDYDGIKELDNNLPPWWIMGFYITIFMSVVYIGYYHFYQDGNIMVNELNAEMQEAEEKRAAYLAAAGSMVDESNVTFLSDAATLAKGKEIFDANCTACHAAKGEGGVGPNLTDDYYLHGGGIVNTFKTIKYGVPAKGMIPWQDQLSPSQMQQVASYVVSLVGTNIPGKEKQGEYWVEGAAEEASEATIEESESSEGESEPMNDAEVLEESQS
jgi:cytochrome c oxidase cbb3-type subunit III